MQEDELFPTKDEFSEGTVDDYDDEMDEPDSIDELNDDEY